MSLDVYLSGKSETTECICSECGHRHEVNKVEDLFRYNVTHNLGRMAEAAGLYEYLWEPETIGITKADQLINPLREGLKELKLHPSKYKKYNPTNGWGNYDILVLFVKNYYEACLANPEATISVSR